jgi:hypothetical protein
MFNIHLDPPEVSRIDYLRLYYYDTHPSENSAAWLTRYDDGQSYVDLAYVGSAGAGGYSTALSPYIGEIADRYSYSYVLNWRPDDLGPGLQLCGLRVAYRLDGGAGDRYYQHVAGTALRPRDGSTTWRYGGSGCLYQEGFATYLPLTLRDY